MARGEISRKDGIEIMKNLPTTLATEEEIKAEECSPPPEFKICHNDKDYVTNDCWSENYRPDIVIKFLDFNFKLKPFVLCYDSESFQKTLELNEYRAWYPNETRQLEGTGLDSTGHGGMPSMVEVYYKIGLNNYISNSPSDLMRVSGTLIGYPIYTNKRVGNPRGEFGVGDVHGQEPGETIYFLIHEYGDKFDLVDQVQRINALKGIDIPIPHSSPKDIISVLDKDTIPTADIYFDILDTFADQEDCAIMFYPIEREVLFDDIYCDPEDLLEQQAYLVDKYGPLQFYVSHDIRNGKFVKKEMSYALKSLITEDKIAFDVMMDWFNS